jgi:hypothetical protein
VCVIGLDKLRELASPVKVTRRERITGLLTSLLKYFTLWFLACFSLASVTSDLALVTWQKDYLVVSKASMPLER